MASSRPPRSGEMTCEAARRRGGGFAACVYGAAAVRGTGLGVVGAARKNVPHRFAHHVSYLLPRGTELRPFTGHSLLGLREAVTSGQEPRPFSFLFVFGSVLQSNCIHSVFTVSCTSLISVVTVIILTQDLTVVCLVRCNIVITILSSSGLFVYYCQFLRLGSPNPSGGGNSDPGASHCKMVEAEREQDRLSSSFKALRTTPLTTIFNPCTRTWPHVPITSSRLHLSITIIGFPTLLTVTVGAVSNT
ncbi:uncharacterized protein LOC134363718 [Cynocephalus volans]|uniref:uncharacterized protein LOC134363718 n=1 Tax=Cynocephalus volans TaxID=110931 RepID=UPI002FCA6D9B